MSYLSKIDMGELLGLHLSDEEEKDYLQIVLEFCRF